MDATPLAREIGPDADGVESARVTHAPGVCLVEQLSRDWRSGLPQLRNRGLTLRELRLSDAPSLLAQLSTEEVARFISPPPTTVAGFERFIEWTLRQRAAGEYVCFAVVPDGGDTVAGLFQIRALNGSFTIAEWGFALGAQYWGTGLFVESAVAVLRFAFTVIGVQRLEARAAVANGRGNGALQKIGAVREGTLRRSLLLRNEYLDQTLWAILSDEWLMSDRQSSRRPTVH